MSERHGVRSRRVEWGRIRRTGVWAAASAAVVMLALGAAWRLLNDDAAGRVWGSLCAPGLTPWESIGGCGAGGSGGGGGSAKWVGKGVSGGLLDVQIMYGNSLGQNFFNNSITARLSIKPSWNQGLGLSIPVASKIGEVQPVTIDDPRYYITGGINDLSLDYSYSFGAENEWSLGLALVLPTGQYDVKRGSTSKTEFLPSSLQKGGGLYSPSLTLSYTKDVAHGLWLFDLGYSHPINMKPFTGKNQFMDTYWSSYTFYEEQPASADRSRFYYRFKPYGENDLGDYSPPGLNLSAFYGYRGVEGYVHSFGVTFAAPLAVAWIHRFQADGIYAPTPDPDHKAWSGTLNYGMEVSRMKFPLFFAVSLPIHDQRGEQSNPRTYSRWDAPDMKDFLQQWSFFVGVKTTMF